MNSQSSLFEAVSLPAEVRENCAKVRKKGPRTFPDPKEEVRKFGGRGSALKVRTSSRPEQRGALFRTSSSGSGSARQNFASSLDQRHQLENQIEGAEAELTVANDQQAPWARAFYTQDRELRRLLAERQQGCPITKREIFNAYDARVAAGHAWHPYKIKATDLERWLKLLRRELKIVNQEIGI